MDNQDKRFAIADKITKFNFKEIWDIEGESMNNLSKKEVAEEMFFKGIAYIIDHLNKMDEINIESIKEKIEKRI